MADNSEKDMDHQVTDADAPQGDQAMAVEDQDKGTDTEGEKADSEAVETEEEVESDGAS